MDAMDEPQGIWRAQGDWTVRYGPDGRDLAGPKHGEFDVTWTGRWQPGVTVADADLEAAEMNASEALHEADGHFLDALTFCDGEGLEGRAEITITSLSCSEEPAEQ